MTTTNIFLITAFIMAVVLNLFFRHKFKWWTLLLFSIIFNLLLGVLAIYVIVRTQSGNVYFNITEDNLAAYFGESLGCTLLAFTIITPLFKRKIPQVKSDDPKWEVKRNYSFNPLTQLQKLPKGIYRLVIVLWLILPIVLGFIVGECSNSWNAWENFFSTLIITPIIYYVLARLGVWVYLGFREDKIQK